ncbi:hypothetical protein AQUCO_03700329v1 [Aquilegia coerulea]|uniref:Uncharacterized protein n=1 Tax=Aquilegia coerulea TaxID=218851 RepID=A0A2G5CUR4_AQUCA|nr:hypothetical protein AQUCO_03700329v1 [Aquilegia coerulea]
MLIELDQKAAVSFYLHPSTCWHMRIWVVSCAFLFLFLFHHHQMAALLLCRTWWGLASFCLCSVLGYTTTRPKSLMGNWELNMSPLIIKL